MPTEETFRIVAPNGVFVRALPVLDTQIDIHERFGDVPGGLVDDLHCTLMYSLSDVDADIPFSLLDKERRYLGYAQQLSYWPGVDGEGYLVLELNSTDMLLSHTKWKLYGFDPTFEVYKPHVTLAHPVNEEEARRYCLMVNSRPYTFLKALRFYNGGFTPLEEKD